jgi:hypothetical protein
MIPQEGSKGRELEIVIRENGAAAWLKFAVSQTSNTRPGAAGIVAG